MRAATRQQLVRAYRDLPLVDREDALCGIVDDIDAVERGGIWELTALLVGTGAWQARRPRWFTHLLPGKKVVRVEAADVASATNVVRLLKRAAELDPAPRKKRR